MRGGAADADAERGCWTIETLVPGGDGMTRLSDGRIAFVDGAYPGDRVEPLAVEAAKGHVRATKWKLVESGPVRVGPSCPVSQECGGCNWMSLSGSGQLAGKAGILKSAFERTGKVALAAPIEVIPSGSGLGYRGRVRFHVEQDGKVGFFARGTHALVEIPECVVCRPEINQALAALRALSPEHLAPFREIEVRVGDADGGVSIRFFPRVRGGPPKNLRVALDALTPRYAVSVDGEPDVAEQDQRFGLPLGTSLSALPGVFTQVNWGVNQALVQAVVDGATSRAVTRFCDAFAGAGNFTLPLLSLGLAGVAIEKDRRAIASARRAARDQGWAPGTFVVGDAAVHLKELSRRGDAFDLLLIDPPRRGAREVLAAVAALEPAYVALCSCDPVTLARDAAVLVASGYRLDEVQAFDMFPQTHHVETLAWLSRAPRRSTPP